MKRHFCNSNHVVWVSVDRYTLVVAAGSDWAAWFNDKSIQRGTTPSSNSPIQTYRVSINSCSISCCWVIVSFRHDGIWFMNLVLAERLTLLGAIDSNKKRDLIYMLIHKGERAIILLAPISFYFRGLWCDEYIINIYVMSFSCLTFFQTSKLVFSSLYLKLYKTSASIGAWNGNFLHCF